MEGGKMGYGGHNHDTAKLLKAVSRTVEPRNFGIGLVAGFLLVTCAYFSTAKFDAIHIALISPDARNAAVGIGTPVSTTAAAAQGSRQPSGSDLGAPDMEDALSKLGSKAEVLDKDDGDGGGKTLTSSEADSGQSASLGNTRKDDTFTRDGEVAPEAGKDEVLPLNDGDSAAPAALLPPLSSEEPANSTQQQGVLADEELQVQDASASSAEKSSNVSSPSSVVHSDPATRPAPAQQIPPALQQETKVPPVQQIPLIPDAKHTGPEESAVARREWKPLCDLATNRRIDWCELDGDVRVHGAQGTVTLVGAAKAEEWRVKPYPRKVDANAMRFVREITVRSTTGGAAGAGAGAECTERRDVPALVFSDRGYVGNYFHAYTDVILPLFLTAKQYGGEVVFLVSDFQMWWLGKFLPVFKALSNYDLVDLAADNRTRCFPRVQVGLTCHSDFSIDPRRAPNGYSMVDFTKFMRTTYSLPRDLAVPVGPNARPRLLIIARAKTRRFVNADEIVRVARKVGFEVVVSEGTHEIAPFAEAANGCDAMLGVHGAGLTNMVFLPTRGVVIQVVPLGGLEFVAGYFRSPSRDMGLEYLEYRIAREESTLTEQFPPDHPIFTDPDGVKSKGWDSLKEAYLDKQDVRLDMRRFRPVLKKAIAHIRANKLQ